MLRRGFLLIGPITFLVVLLLPIKSLSYQGQVVLALALWMAIWWLTEAIPIPATSLLPLVILPLFDVMTSKEVSSPYADHNIFLFIGGFFIARAMEKYDLHRRIALHITLLLKGGGDRTVVLGFMLATSFLSLWISNTATTMMLPMALALFTLRENHDPSFEKSLMLGIAYAASIGGIGTLVGTPPNIVFAGLTKKLLSVEVSFTRWLAIGLPVTLTFLPITWWYLTMVRFKLSNDYDPETRKILKNELNKLGPLKYEEKVVLGVFLLVALLWILRKSIQIGPVHIPGWADILGIEKVVHDSTVAILGAVILFIIPSRREGGILDWRTAVQIPWGVVLLFGSGFALAHAFKTSGLSEWFGQILSVFSHLPVPLIVVIVAIMVTFLTELTSNTATTTLLLPVMFALSSAINVNPILLMLPTVLSASCAFMLPVATPPNAIVFGSEKLSIKDMATSGIALNLIGVLIVSSVTLLLGRFF